MDYGFKITSRGRALIAACGGLAKPLRVTRVAVGSGMVPEGVDLAGVNELYQYVTEGAVSERRHEDNILYLTVQYANSKHLEQPDFTLSEFIIFAEDPEKGGDAPLIYATLGDFRQPVPAYSPGVPESVFSYPIILAVSDEVKVEITASPGLVLREDLERAVTAHNDDPKAHGGAVRVEIGREPPENGPALWFCDGDYTPVPSTLEVTLVLGEEGEASDVLVNIDGEDHPVTNATREETESGETAVTIQ